MSEVVLLYDLGLDSVQIDKDVDEWGCTAVWLRFGLSADQEVDECGCTALSLSNSKTQFSYQTIKLASVYWIHEL